MKAQLGVWVWAYQAFTIIWLVFGLSFVFMVNLLMMDYIRGKSKKYTKQLSQNSKKSMMMLRKMAERSSVKNLKQVMTPKKALKRTESLPCIYTPSQTPSRFFLDEPEFSLEIDGNNLDIFRV